MSKITLPDVASYVMMLRRLRSESWEPRRIAAVTSLNLSEFEIDNLLALGGRITEQMDYLETLILRREAEKV